jgi:hypothetical protein
LQNIYQKSEFLIIKTTFFQNGSNNFK